MRPNELNDNHEADNHDTTVPSYSSKLEMKGVLQLEQRQQAKHQVVLFTTHTGSSDDG